jgi:hypothetical protein
MLGMNVEHEVSTHTLLAFVTIITVPNCFARRITLAT